MDFLALINPVSSVVNKVIDMIPDPNARQKAQLEIETAIKMAEIENTKAQLEINKVEAANANFFVSGARPAALWIGNIGLLYVAIIDPLARFIAQVGFGYTGAFPVIDSDLTIGIVGAILGLSGWRSWDKKNGVAR